MKENILIHICCAPCLCYPFSVLEKNYNVIGFWFNPNIHPFSEFQKRIHTLYGYQIKKGLKIFYDEEYDVRNWLLYTKKGWENKNKELRCSLCYEYRLKRTIEKAKKENIKKFTSTLLYSKYQFHSIIKKIGERLSTENGIEFVYIDFTEGWKKGIEISHQLNLYRQRYCGCIFSEQEAILSR